MALNGAVHTSGQYALLYSNSAITAAFAGAVGTTFKFLSGSKYLIAQSIFVVGGGGTTCKVWIQTSLDGTNWFDIMSHAFTTSTLNKWGAVSADVAAAAPATPTDASLADNTINQGLLGRWFRAKVTTTGTFTGTTTLNVVGIVKG